MDVQKECASALAEAERHAQVRHGNASPRAPWGGGARWSADVLLLPGRTTQRPAQPRYGTSPERHSSRLMLLTRAQPARARDHTVTDLTIVDTAQPERTQTFRRRSSSLRSCRMPASVQSAGSGICTTQYGSVDPPLRNLAIVASRRDQRQRGGPRGRRVTTVRPISAPFHLFTRLPQTTRPFPFCAVRLRADLSRAWRGSMRHGSSATRHKCSCGHAPGKPSACLPRGVHCADISRRKAVTCAV